MRLVGVTSCPTGIAHTYMAAEALEQAAREAGHEMVVETQGSAGSEPLDQSVIDAADAVIFAHDLEVRDAGRFAGKPTVDVGVKRAVSDAPTLVAQAVEAAEQARTPSPAGSAGAASGDAAGGARSLTLVGVTSCPTGIAHTYMAAEGLEQAAKDAGHTMVVETQGSAGSEPLDQSVIDAADGVIFAHDLEVKDVGRFAGKPTVDVGVKRAVSDSPALIAEIERLVAERGQAGSTAPAAAAATTTAAAGATPAREGERVGTGTKIRQWLMTGVSYMIPFVAAGGIMIALGFMLAQLFGGKQGAIDVTSMYTLNPAGATDKVTVLQNAFNPGDGMHWAALLFLIGAAAFGFLVPILSGFIAYGIADRPGLVPGIVGGFIANTMGAGFLGGIVTGFLAGFVARWISGWKVHKGVRGVMPVVVIPLLSTLITAGAMILLLGRPIKGLMDALSSGLTSMSGSNAVLLGLILGLMMGFDLGGPVNKVAYTFGTTGLSAVAAGATDAPQLKIMAAVMGAGMVAPWGMALATALRPKLFTKAEQENGKASWLLGASFISEGAIPFAAADPWRVILSSMVGSGVAGALIMAFGSGSRAPHGGLWVTPLITNPLMFLLSVIVGSVITGLLVVALKGADESRRVVASTSAAQDAVTA
ncbi:PTS fructose-like transporter subunit IIB [uncultured Arsenicicoccus sp.]|uniref:PTS fructose-like transporter subunit IIB n=1 Tax=uncultured Arsenicicoccus sp. TaxID=491339 RepID=UPI0025984D0C|nr:PTS fructose-like transporter subunit IIB [uncultured Arsenicicoccus sp.]